MAPGILTDALDRLKLDDAPMICRSCIGDSPHVFMMSENSQTECKICTGPFTVYSWIPAGELRRKDTKICDRCSKLKNLCHICLHDL